MSDNFPDGDQQQSLQTHMKERAEFISGVVTNVLEEEGYQSAADQAGNFFANKTPQQWSK